ncbi:MAG: hypothetical protein ACTSP4_11930 [Candidatus Hodarchaeales archaeon]
MRDMPEDKDQDGEEKENAVYSSYTGENDDLSGNESVVSNQHLLASSSIEDEIITLLSARSGWSYTFSGIRRLIGAHQQTLTNALDRLVDDSILIKDQTGYQLNNTISRHGFEKEKRGLNTLSEWYRLNDNSKDKNERIWIGRTPIFISVVSVAKKMAGRWFSSFRFTGSFIDSRKNLARLEWVDLRNSTDHMCVEIRHDSIKVVLQNINSETRSDSCLNFVHGIISKLGIYVYFELENFAPYGHGEEYNN